MARRRQDGIRRECRLAIFGRRKASNSRNVPDQGQFLGRVSSPNRLNSNSGSSYSEMAEFLLASRLPTDAPLLLGQEFEHRRRDGFGGLDQQAVAGVVENDQFGVGNTAYQLL